MDKQKDQIQFDDFLKLDIRVGEVISAEKVEDSTKLIELRVNFGDLGERTILTGMQKWYLPEDFTNKKMLFIVNLPPRKMAGSVSEGMVLSVGTDLESKPILITLDEEARSGESVS